MRSPETFRGESKSPLKATAAAGGRQSAAVGAMGKRDRADRGERWRGRVRAACTCRVRRPIRVASGARWQLMSTPRARGDPRPLGRVGLRDGTWLWPGSRKRGLWPCSLPCASLQIRRSPGSGTTRMRKKRKMTPLATTPRRRFPPRQGSRWTSPAPDWTSTEPRTTGCRCR